jgi:hypothetical protein
VPGAVKYPLTNVVEGKSKTVIDASLADLLKGNFSAMVHLSDKDLAKWVSCGNVKTSTMLAPTAPMSSAPSDNSGKSGY